MITLSVHARIVEFKNSTSAIYGKDDRAFVAESSSQIIKNLSNSIAMVTSVENIQMSEFSSTLLGNILTDKDGANICESELFGNHKGIKSCTGFLIAEDLLATAGHCVIDEEDCRNKVIAFNILATQENDLGFEIKNEDIYNCKEIISRKKDVEKLIDYTIIRLDRKVSGRIPLKLSQKNKVKSSDSLFMIGHPLGLPLIKTTNSFIVENNHPHVFKSTIDSFFGNSGSPVFNSKTQEVEGMLISGQDDFVEDPTFSCNQYKQYDENSRVGFSLNGETILRIRELIF